MLRTCSSSAGFTGLAAALGIAATVCAAPSARAQAPLAGAPTVPAAPAATASPAAAAPRLVSAAVLPTSTGFRFWQGLIVFKATVGDNDAADAVLDTGLPLCIMAPEFAAKRALAADTTRDMDILDRSVKVSNAQAQGLRIEAMTLSGVSFGVFNVMHYLSSRPTADAPPVWIGNSGLLGLILTVDPHTQRVTVQQPGYTPPTSATIVPFTVKDGRIWVTAKANGKKTFTALLDTGSVGTLLPASIVKDLKLKPAASFTMTHPNGKEGKVGAVALGEITLGSLKIPDVQALYVEDQVKDGLDPDFGIIGNDVLMRYRVTFDYVNQRLVLEKLGTTDGSKAETHARGATQPNMQPAGGGYRGSLPTGGFPQAPTADPSRRRLGP